MYCKNNGKPKAEGYPYVLGLLLELSMCFLLYLCSSWVFSWKVLGNIMIKNLAKTLAENLKQKSGQKHG